jgi:hypothetical protein
MASATQVWDKIEARLDGIVREVNVPLAAIEEIDAVMEQHADQAKELFPGNDEAARAKRVDFWYRKYLARFSTAAAKSQAAKYFIQVMTSYIRGAQALRYTDYSIDESGCVNPAA